MKNCGFPALRIVRTRAPDRRARRLARGAEDVLAGAARFPDVAAAVADCGRVVGFTSKERRFGPRLETFDAAAAAELASAARAGRVAALFGPERRGLEDRDLRSCARLFRLRASPDHPVYNLAQAVALALHAVAFGGAHACGSSAAEVSTRALPQSELDVLSGAFAEALSALGHPPPRRPHDRTARILERFRRQMTRACVEPSDALLWRSFLGRVAERARRSSEAVGNWDPAGDDRPAAVHGGRGIR
jgi:TrmH family RNA methyltransferase